MPMQCNVVMQNSIEYIETQYNSSMFIDKMSTINLEQKIFKNTEYV